jgi:hypothetical protein
MKEIDSRPGIFQGLKKLENTRRNLQMNLRKSNKMQSYFLQCSELKQFSETNAKRKKMRQRML